MYLTASPSIDQRALWRAPSWFDLTDEAQPRRVQRTDAPSLFAPFIRGASASGAPASPIPFPPRASRNRNAGMTASIEPSLSFDVYH